MSEPILRHVKDRRRGEGGKEVCRQRGAGSWEAEVNSDGLAGGKAPRALWGLRGR